MMYPRPPEPPPAASPAANRAAQKILALLGATTASHDDVAAIVDDQLAKQPPAFVSAEKAATRLGVPITLLRGEAKLHLLPHLRIRRRLLFNVEAVREALMARAQEGRSPCSDTRQTAS